MPSDLKEDGQVQCLESSRWPLPCLLQVYLSSSRRRKEVLSLLKMMMAHSPEMHHPLKHKATPKMIFPVLASEMTRDFYHVSATITQRNSRLTKDCQVHPRDLIVLAQHKCVFHMSKWFVSNLSFKQKSLERNVDLLTPKRFAHSFWIHQIADVEKKAKKFCFCLAFSKCNVSFFFI